MIQKYSSSLEKLIQIFLFKINKEWKTNMRTKNDKEKHFVETNKYDNQET